MITITAINPKYQALINRFIKWDKRYSDIVDATQDSMSAPQANAYEKAACIFVDLPKREQKNIQRQITGY
ncbi:MAG: hypothetical protein COA84_14120 [Robiginitomaculum sp.]|nr:MAG: hypothetical protein COA84_14120 [Robiginitomaculum sp.]